MASEAIEEHFYALADAIGAALHRDARQVADGAGSRQHAHARLHGFHVQGKCVRYVETAHLHSPQGRDIAAAGQTFAEIAGQRLTSSASIGVAVIRPMPLSAAAGAGVVSVIDAASADTVRQRLVGPSAIDSTTILIVDFFGITSKHSPAYY